MPATIADVARAAGVSPATVSNAFNHPDRVQPATLERVRSVVADLGYVPNASARHLRVGRSRTVALLVPDLSNPFFAELARGVESVAAAHDLTVFVCNSDGSPEGERRYLSALQEQRVLGLLLTPVAAQVEGLSELESHGIPVVMVDAPGTGQEHCSVAVDDLLGAGLAIRHLASLGHRSAVFVNGPSDIPQCVLREQGVRQAARRRLRVSHVRASAMTVDAGAHAVRELGDSVSEIEAVFCANDLLAVGALQALVELGRRVPEDVTLVGYDDIPMVTCTAVPISSVARPAREMGVKAMQLLLAELAGQGRRHKHAAHLFEPHLVVRGSSRLAAARSSA